MADVKGTVASRSSSTGSDDDSGLVADAFDVLPDENTLALDEDLLFDLGSLGDDECLERYTNTSYHDSSLEGSLELIDEGTCKDIYEDDVFLDEKEYNKQNNERVPSLPNIKQTSNNFVEKRQDNNKANISGKLVAFNKEEARNWRRKRLLNSQTQKSTSENSLRRDKLKPLLPLPDILKPLKDKRKVGSVISEMKLQNPLLGGEKIKHQRGPMPMKLRALPESFWKEPTSIKTSSLGRSNYAVLPPLFSTENQNDEDVLNVRPITPPDEKSKSPGDSPKHKKKWVMKGEPDTELLFSLFDHLENQVDEKLLVRRGRPKKNINEKTPRPPQRDTKEDPCIVDDLAEKLFPDLALSQRAKEKVKGSNYAIIKIGQGKSTMEFPAIQADQNYPAILNELVTHM